MTTDDERREVARRLLNIGFLGNFGDVANAVGFSDDMTWRVDELSARLADLIDPGLSKSGPEFDNSAVDSSVAVKGRTVDRDALLKLADELEGLKPVIVLGRHARCEYARLIREALGAEK